jgi:hypothetical protein
MPSIHSRPENVVDLNATAASIEKTIVAESSKKSYLPKLAEFMEYLLETDPSYLEDSIVPIMQLKKVEDESIKRSEARRMSQPKKSRKKRPQRLRNRQTMLRRYCLNLLRKLQPLRDGQPHNSPIKIDGNGSILDWDITRKFLSSKRKKIEVNTDVAKNYVKKHNLDIDIADSDEKVEVLVVGNMSPVSIV